MIGDMRIRPLLPADATLLADLHRATFPAGEAWSAASFTEMIGSSGVYGWGSADGTGTLIACLIARTAADESEILTLAVAPTARRKGRATHLVRMFLGESARRGAPDVFLEVAEDNAPAHALYGVLGFLPVGRRPHYYPGDRTALLFRWSAPR